MSDLIKDITPSKFIMTLFIRDDGERLLLGGQEYEFNSKYKAFARDRVVNSVFDLQGTDGAVISGQVRRSSAQEFKGFIGTNATKESKVLNMRTRFFQFFQMRHYYDAIYITDRKTYYTPGGTTAQIEIPYCMRRMRGYITAAPEAQTDTLGFCEYSVSLAFEDPNYYLYAETNQGKEILTLQSNIELFQVNNWFKFWEIDNPTGFATSPVITLFQLPENWSEINFQRSLSTQANADQWITITRGNFYSTYTFDKMVVDCRTRKVTATIYETGQSPSTAQEVVISQMMMSSADFTIGGNKNATNSFWVKVTGSNATSIIISAGANQVCQ